MTTDAQVVGGSSRRNRTTAFHFNAPKYQKAMTFMITIPIMVGVGLLVWWLIDRNIISVFSVVLGGIMFILTGLGITVVFHRHLTHDSFRFTNRQVRAVAIMIACMAVEGNPIHWMIVHIWHHLRSDADGDPHSPWQPLLTFAQATKAFWRERPKRGEQVLLPEPSNSLAAFWQKMGGILWGLNWAHWGWIVFGGPIQVDKEILEKFKDDEDVQWCVEHYGQLVLASLWIPALIGLCWGLLREAFFGVPTIGGILSGGLREAFVCLLVAGILRIAFVQHVTWSVNSLCHVFGAKPFDKEGSDESRDLPFVYPLRECWNPFKLASSLLGQVLNVLGLGEPNHAGHHAFMKSAKHALASKWQLDISYLVILLMEKLGWVDQVWTPKQAAVDKLRVKP